MDYFSISFLIIYQMMWYYKIYIVVGHNKLLIINWKENDYCENKYTQNYKIAL